MLKTQKLIYCTASKKSHVWYLSHVSDHYVKESKRVQNPNIKLNYRSRAAFKLQNMQDTYKLIRPKDIVLDLGSSPGGWSQVAVELTKSTEENIQVFSVDLLSQKAITGVKFMQGDIKSDIIINTIKSSSSEINCILSDMAPNFSGDINDDHISICQLNTLTMIVATKCLKEGGNLVMKTLSGPQENDFYNFYSKFFKTFNRDKPLASKGGSSELFYIGRQFGGNIDYKNIIKLIRNKSYQIVYDDMKKDPLFKEFIIELELT